MKNAEIAKAENPSTEIVAQKELEKLFFLDSSLPFPGKNPRPVKSVMSSVTVAKIVDSITSGDWYWEGYQRDGVWDWSRKKALYYSVVHGMPVPPIMLVKHDTRYAIIDGGQRIRALCEYSVKLHEIIDRLEYEIAIPGMDAKTRDERQLWRDDCKDALDKLCNATIQVIIYDAMQPEVEQYAYAALNNGKTHTGADWGKAFLPPDAMEFILTAQDKAKSVMPTTRKATEFSLYLWGAIGGKLGKTPAGKKLFPVVKSLSTLDSTFRFPVWHDGLDNFVRAIATRPTKDEYATTISDFCKPGYLVPMVQGLKLYTTCGNVRSEADTIPPENWHILSYVVGNLNKYDNVKITFACREARKNSKSGAVKSTTTLSKALAQTGSGEALTLRRARAWEAVIKIAASDMDNTKTEDIPADVSEIMDAIDAIRGGDDD